MVKKIWLKSYPKQVPAEIDANAYQSLAEMIDKNCEKFATKIAFSNLGTKLSYADLDKHSRNFAAFLQQDLGLKKGDRVAMMLPNILQYPVAMFGILRAGLVVVNVNPLYTVPELTHQLKDSQAKAIIVLANFANVLEQAWPNLEVKHVIVTELGDMMGPVKSTLINLAVKYIKRMVPKWDIPTAISFHHALARGAQQTFNTLALHGDDVAYLQYTGGTTGVAKGAVLTHKNMLANIMQASAWFTGVIREGVEVVVMALPLYHIFSLTCGLVFLNLGGHGLLITNPRDIPHFIRELKKNPFSVFIGLNTLYNALMHNPEFANLGFASLRLSTAGGMTMQRVVAEKWQSMTKNFILEGYGLTEASPIVTINPTNITQFTGSIGLPVPSTDIKICDEEGKEMPLGESGELWVKGPQVMQGYWQKPEETNNVLSKDGWLKTGDIVRMDENGFVYMVDRKKDMVIVSGFNVYPNEVEEVIASHPKVLEVGVIGVSNEHSGETVKAFVVKRDSSLTEKELLDFCYQRLTRYKVPKIIEFRAELPKSNVGKILRRKLRE